MKMSNVLGSLVGLTISLGIESISYWFFVTSLLSFFLFFFFSIVSHSGSFLDSLVCFLEDIRNYRTPNKLMYSILFAFISKLVIEFPFKNAPQQFIYYCLYLSANL